MLFLLLRWKRGGGDDGYGRLLPSMGVRLAFDAGEVWHLAGEKRRTEWFFFFFTSQRKPKVETFHV